VQFAYNGAVLRRLHRVIRVFDGTKDVFCVLITKFRTTSQIYEQSFARSLTRLARRGVPHRASNSSVCCLFSRRGHRKTRICIASFNVFKWFYFRFPMRSQVRKKKEISIEFLVRKDSENLFTLVKFDNLHDKLLTTRISRSQSSQTRTNPRRRDE